MVLGLEKLEDCPNCGYTYANQMAYDIQLCTYCKYSRLFGSFDHALVKTKRRLQMVDKTSPIKDALGDNYEQLTSLQQAIVDFGDRMHQRLKQFNADDDAAMLVENNVGKGSSNIARLLSNVSQLAKADAQSVFNQTAAADAANLAMILDLVHAERFIA